ncbi:hypothetical protein ABKN59_000539 [Abortiporus biennis]
MSYSALSSSAFFPTSTAAPNAFGIFSTTQSPRDTYNMYEEFGFAIRPANQNRKRTTSNTSSSSMKSGFRKFFSGKN